MSFFRRVGFFFLDLMETVVISLAVFVVVYLLLFQPHQVRGNSMYPTFSDGEYILTEKISYRLKDPQRGDVIIFHAPRNEEYDYIKRVIGLPGETIKIENNHIFINDQLLVEHYLPTGFLTHPGSFLQKDSVVRVPEKAYFVLGDNRNHSSDSREWGFVPRQNIVGRAWIRYWPLDRAGIVPAAAYQF